MQAVSRIGTARDEMMVHPRTQALRIVDLEDDTILSLEPLQGLWTEDLYLVMTDHARRLIEYTDGYVKLLSMPTPEHQSILAFLYELFVAFLRPNGGRVLFSPLRVQVRPRKYREPDLAVLLDKHDARQTKRFWIGADLVVEVVSEDDLERDTVEKVADYAEAGIPKYWIVNPLNETITVLTLNSDVYAEHGVFRRGEQAMSLLLTGFAVNVDTVLDAE